MESPSGFENDHIVQSGFVALGTDDCVCPPVPTKPSRSYVPGTGSERCFPFAAADCPRVTEQLYSVTGNPCIDVDVLISLVKVDLLEASCRY